MASDYYTLMNEIVTRCHNSLSLIIVSFVCIFVICHLINLYVCGSKEIKCNQKSKVLVVIAHPDDETMFFGPAIVKLAKSCNSLNILCVTSGNYYGQGQVRKQELVKAVTYLGIPKGNVTIMDSSRFQDGDPKWEEERLSRIVLDHLEKLDCNIILTFDEYGISGHENHKSCFKALQYLYSNGFLPKDVQVFVLESVSIWRKYISWFDLSFSMVSSTYLFKSTLSEVLSTYQAMRQHKSQLLWFRYLYLLFSRYIFINSFKRMPMPKIYVKKNRR
uniref:N-acetylglucosaminylphosphatidylinositol deacetylase n=1 Tax=Rhabditophanes sp. KR3021 TaxID=114890 RepID=A0AC35TH62_9BILA